MRILLEALKNLFRRPFTRRYPKVKPEIPKDFRGKLIHNKARCIYCGLCAKFCPSNAITVDLKKKVWIADLGKCLFCGQCQEVCAEIVKQNAIILGKEYELAVADKKRLIA